MKKKGIVAIVLALLVAAFTSFGCKDKTSKTADEGTQTPNTGEISPTPEEGEGETPDGDVQAPEEEGGTEKAEVVCTITYAIAPQCEVDEGMLDVLKMVLGEYPDRYTEGVGTSVSDLRSDIIVDGSYRFVFVDWYYDEACSLLCADGIIDAEQTGNVTLYAKVEKISLADSGDQWA